MCKHARWGLILERSGWSVCFWDMPGVLFCSAMKWAACIGFVDLGGRRALNPPSPRPSLFHLLEKKLLGRWWMRHDTSKGFMFVCSMYAYAITSLVTLRTHASCTDGKWEKGAWGCQNNIHQQSQSDKKKLKKPSRMNNIAQYFLKMLQMLQVWMSGSL